MTDEINNLKNQVDNYLETIHAIISFAHFIRWQKTTSGGEFRANSLFYIGRKMDTSEENRISPNNKVTPDIIVQNDSNYGLVAEVKKTLPQNSDHWNKLRKQIIKYDDNLKGWKNSDGYIKNFDITLVIHTSLKKKVIDYIEEIKKSGELDLQRKFAVIIFYKFTEREEKIIFETIWGKLSNEELDQMFKEYTPIKLQKVITSNKNIKFYDDKPPLPYTMSILWDLVFSNIPPIDVYMDSRGLKIMKIKIDTRELKNLVKEQFTYSDDSDPRLPDIPRLKWIKEAMDKFVELNYASKVGNSEYNYIVRYRRIKSPLDKFCEEYIKGMEEQRYHGHQLTLDKFNP